MNTNQIDAQEMFHKVSERLEDLNKEFVNFNAQKIGNINSEKAEEFRRKLVELEAEANSYFEKFCYSK